jgi:hypothetical protein
MTQQDSRPLAPARTGDGGGAYVASLSGGRSSAVAADRAIARYGREWDGWL